MRYKEITNKNPVDEALKEGMARRRVSSQKLQQIAHFAATDEDAQSIWTEVKPNLSGADHTFWVSMDDEYPFIIVNPVAGVFFLPDENCQAFPYGRNTGLQDVDLWLRSHKQILSDLLHGKIDQHQFYQTFGSQNLKEMATVPTRLTGLPFVVQCDQRRHSADARVKVSTSPVSGKKSLLATYVSVRANKTEGQALSPAVLDSVRKWIVLNHHAIMDLWDGRIQDTQQFLARVQSLKGHENDQTLDWDAYIAKMAKKP